jgi:hypothetical protein
VGARALPAALALALLAGCGGGDGDRAGTATTTAGKRAAAPPLCGELAVQRLGTVRGGNVSELSGLAAGRGDRLFAIEDSGNSATVIVMRRDGRVLGRPAVTGAQNLDWEDIAARGRELFIADIGDNATTRPSIQVYRIAAPPPTVAAVPASTITLRYPGVPRDAEALLADPLRDQLLVITKGLLDAQVYAARLRGGTMRKGPRLNIGLVTGGSISPDGRTIALRTYDEIAVWRRRGSEPLTRTLSRDPCFSPTSLAGEGQGEAIALDGDAAAITAPEGRRPVLRRYAAR